MEKKLSDLETGEGGIVLTISGSSRTRRRIMDMGIVRGAEIRVIRRAPLGDPVEFAIKDYNLSLRKRDAENIYVELETDY